MITDSDITSPDNIGTGNTAGEAGMVREDELFPSWVPVPQLFKGPLFPVGSRPGLWGLLFLGQQSDNK